MNAYVCFQDIDSPCYKSDKYKSIKKDFVVG